MNRQVHISKKIVFCILIIVFSCSLLLVGCTPSNNSDNVSNTNNSDGKRGLLYLWDCEYVADKESYDINDVTLTFIYGYRGDCSRASYEQLYTLYPIYENEEEIEYSPVAIYLYFSTFGNEYLIKTIDDIFDEEYLAKNHREQITVPAELFFDEYGMIRFYFCDSEDKNDTKFGATGTYWCKFYYHKDGNTVYISDNDLAPPYQYHNKYLIEDEIEASPYIRSGFLSYPANNSLTKDLCGFVTKHVTYYDLSAKNDLDVLFYFGRMYGEEEKIVPKVDVYIVTEASGVERKMFLRTVDDYMSDEYKCKIMYDYNGKIREIIYNHSEKITIPSEMFIGEEGTIKLRVCDTESQNEIGSIAFKYFFTAYKDRNRIDIHLDR